MTSPTKLSAAAALLLSGACTTSTPDPRSSAPADARIPSASTFTTAPLRHRLRVELHAPPLEVWALVGDHTRLPEYSAGIERVEVIPGGDARVCHFRPRDGAAEGMSFREHVRWEAAGVGHATTGDPANGLPLANDLSFVTLAPSARGTVFTWEQYYDSPDLPAMRAEFDPAFADIGARLVARFGGRVVERWVDGPAMAGAGR